MSASARSGKPRTTFCDETFALIRRLVSEGVTSAEIAARIGTTPGSLRVTCCRRGIPLRHRRASPEQHARQHVWVRVPIEIRETFEAAAKRRGYTREQFISAILMTIAQDNLFEAVLDENPARGAEGRMRVPQL